MECPRCSGRTRPKRKCFFGRMGRVGISDQYRGRGKLVVVFLNRDIYIHCRPAVTHIPLIGISLHGRALLMGSIDDPSLQAGSEGSPVMTPGMWGSVPLSLFQRTNGRPEVLFPAIKSSGVARTTLDICLPCRRDREHLFGVVGHVSTPPPQQEIVFLRRKGTTGLTDRTPPPREESSRSISTVVISPQRSAAQGIPYITIVCEDHALPALVLFIWKKVPRDDMQIINHFPLTKKRQQRPQAWPFIIKA